MKLSILALGTIKMQLFYFSLNSKATATLSRIVNILNLQHAKICRSYLTSWLILVVTGCATTAPTPLQTMVRVNMPGCAWFQAVLGGWKGPLPPGQIRGVVATGGVEIRECIGEDEEIPPLVQ